MSVLRGAVTIVLLLLNTALWGTPILVGGIFKLLLPRSEIRRRVILALSSLAERWVAVNDAIFDTFLPVQWDIEGADVPDRNGHYLVLSNHNSWVDIFTLFRIFHGRAGFIRFFMKSQLLWFPIVGQACWALEFPFMRRYSPEYLQQHPEKRGRDLVVARRMCRRYRRIPVTVAVFLEGTRFTREKQENQSSPYRHLLRPRIGAISFAMAALGDQLDAVYDVTIAYPGGDASLWDFVSGKLRRVSVRARLLSVPPEFLTPAITETGPTRERFKAWIDQIWREKDAQLDGRLTTTAA